MSVVLRCVYFAYFFRERKSVCVYESLYLHRTRATLKYYTPLTGACGMFGS